MEQFGAHNIPIQTVSYADKVKDDYAFVKTTMRAYINLSFNYSTNYRLDVKKLYDYYNGHVYQDDYSSVLKPYGKSFEGFPQTVKNYPIIKPKIDLLRGEFAKRPDICTVVVVNEDARSEMLEYLNQKVEASLHQVAINAMNAAGVNGGMESQETRQPGQIAEEVTNSWRDKKADVGQAALNYIKRYNNLSEWFNIGFLDMLIAGETYSYKTVVNKEPYYEVVNPLDIDFDKDPDLQYIEDADWVCRRKYMNPSTVVDTFYTELTKDEVEQIERPQHVNITPSAVLGNLDERVNSYRRTSRLVEVIHVCWKTRKKVGILSYIDEYGQPQEMIVDETYTPDKLLGETVEWLWVNEAWQGFRIDGNIFKSMGPIPSQRASLDNISKCKLPYNGRILSNRNSRNISPVMLGVPFQVLYNIVHYRMELALAKMKDTISLLDINVLPKNWPIEKFLAYVDYTGVGFVDYNKEGVRLNPQHQTSVKLASDTIGSYLELLANIKHEWDDLIGITKQREGQVSASETVGGVERAVVQSSLITEIYFTIFDQFREKEYQGLMDSSRLAWIEGKKASFVMPDVTKPMYLSIDGADYANTEYGVFASNSPKDKEKLMKLEAFAQALIQNGTPGSTVAEILDHESFSQMKSALQKAEAKNNEWQQHMEELKGKQQEALLERELQNQETLHQYALEEIDRKGEWDLKGKQAAALGMDEGVNSAEIMGLQNENNIKNRELDIKQTEIQQKDADSRRKAESEKYKADMSLKVAKSRPKTPAKK